MTTSVKLFTHSGVVAPDLIQSSRFQTDAVFMLKQPYLARETISAGVSALSSAAPLSANTHVTLLHIQVEAGKFIRYEINPNGRSVTADANSPLLSGHETFQFGVDWTISIIEAS